MKKLFLCVLAWLVLLTAGALANQEIVLPEINIQFALPDSYECEINRELTTGIDLGKKAVIHSPDGIMLTITAINVTGTDFNLLSDEEILQQLSSQNEYAAMGFNFTDISVFRTEYGAFLVGDIDVDMGGLHMKMRQYSTLKDNISTNFTFGLYDEFTPMQQAQMQSIVSSVRWMEEGEETYTRKEIRDAGISILVPDHWLYDASSNGQLFNRGFIKTPADGEKRIILLVYGDAAPTLQIVCGMNNREEMNMQNVSKQIFAFYLAGVNSNQLESVTVNGRDFYRYLLKNPDGATLYQYFHLHQGTLLMFQFDKGPDDMYYPVFETVLNSMEYLP